MASNSGDHTYIDPESVRAAAGRIGGLMNDMDAFYRISDLETLAGRFPAATWLAELVHQRQICLLQHAIDLKLVLGDIKSNLDQISHLMEETDRTNANSLERDVFHQVNLMKVEGHRDTVWSKELARPVPEPDAESASE